MFMFVLCATTQASSAVVATSKNGNQLELIAKRRLDPIYVQTFDALRTAVANAPTDGETQTVVKIDGDLDAWTTSDGVDKIDEYSNTIVQVNAGQHVIVQGTGSSISTLDAAASGSSRRRLFVIESGGTLEIENLKLTKGYVVNPLSQTF